MNDTHTRAYPHLDEALDPVVPDQHSDTAGRSLVLHSPIATPHFSIQPMVVNGYLEFHQRERDEASE